MTIKQCKTLTSNESLKVRSLNQNPPGKDVPYQWDSSDLYYITLLTKKGILLNMFLGTSGHHIRLWTINGSLVAAQDCRVAIRCVTFSNMDEGTSINVVAGGLENGTVRLWSTWDLSVVRDITTNSVRQPIVW